MDDLPIIRRAMLRAVHRERERQDSLHPQQANRADQMVVLMEEVGEVAQAIQDGDEVAIQRELVHVAAYAIRMIEDGI